MIVTAEAAKCGSVRVLVLDAAPGETVQDRRLADPAAGHNITMAPLAADGMIMVGVSGGGFDTPGFTPSLVGYRVRECPP